MTSPEAPETSPLEEDAFVARLRALGSQRYHDKHPFHVRMHKGELSREQLQAWVLNRYYYQTRVPIKDAIILSKLEDPAWRRRWIRRIHDHDGQAEGEGGLFLWQKLATGVGLDPQEMTSLAHVLPAVRFACDAYVTLVRERPIVEAIASSLTEFFSPDIMTTRIAAWQTHYPWIDPDLQGYFRRRVPQARRDSEEALSFVLTHARTRDEQERCLAAFTTKCDILWSLLDAVDRAFPPAQPSP
ncbi:MAG: pyrroloquinoline-quinone synthase PqqC [Myxococcales bacterium]|nr:pyrroloquinoline-quinone synthase PqqC [Myxococcales bacterium]MDD9971434.1 pyrroloquinoline-quinone synthase PqqC [Myxococcales bacterium]